MSATKIWLVEWLNCIPTDGDLTDVVVTAGWRCNGVQTEGDETYDATIYSTCSFPMPDGTFTPYADLTQEQVLGWCWANGVDKDATEASIQAQIDAKINPPLVQPPLPWA